MNKEIVKCDCYKERIERHYFNDFERGWNVSHGIYDKYKERVISYCAGTKECDPCSCNGDRRKCDFYEEVRRKARKEIKMKDIRLEVSARVYNILLEFMKSLKIKSFGVTSKWKSYKHILTIYTNYPGLIIGKQGTILQQLLDKIHEDKLDADIDIVLEEVDFFIRDDNESYTDKEQAEFMNDYMMARGF